MCCAVSSTDGRGVLIFFLISVQNIGIWESQGRVWGGGGGRGVIHGWFSQHFILCSDVNIMKLLF